MTGITVTSSRSFYYFPTGAAIVYGSFSFIFVVTSFFLLAVDDDVLALALAEVMPPVVKGTFPG